MATLVYDQFKADLASAALNWTDNAGVTVKALLVDSTSTYVAANAHKHLSDFTANGGVESAATGYARQTVNGRSVTQDDNNNRVEFIANNLAFGALSNGTLKAILLFKDTGVAATSDLIAYIDTGGFPLVTNGGTVSVNWNAAGVFTLT